MSDVRCKEYKYENKTEYSAITSDLESSLLFKFKQNATLWVAKKKSQELLRVNTEIDNEHKKHVLECAVATRLSEFIYLVADLNAVITIYEGKLIYEGITNPSFVFLNRFL